jgi:hypothetical protein
MSTRELLAMDAVSKYLCRRDVNGRKAVFDAILAPNVEIGYWRALLHSIII